MLISEVARLADVTSATIHYYEEIGLLTAPSGSLAGYRQYSHSTVEELLFIKKAQGLGFSLDGDQRDPETQSCRSSAVCARP